MLNTESSSGAVAGGPHPAKASGDAGVEAVLIAGSFILLPIVLVAALAWYGHYKPSAGLSLAAQVDNARDPLIQPDFLRIAFLPPGTPVDKLGSKDALRVFAGSSPYFSPPMSVAQTVTYPGLSDAPEKELVAMRCKPVDTSQVEPILATWPNVMQAITTDLGSKKLTCPAKAGDTENEVYCIAKSYTDNLGANVTTVLSGTLKAASDFYQGDSKKGDWLKNNYGIYPAFSGLGLSVKDSYTLDPQHPLSAAVMLRNSITPEYLLRNVTLQAASCRCIRVAPYPERSQDPIDPDFIWQKGGDGTCTVVKKLCSTEACQ
jgi:hypothetical protein